VTVIDAFAGPGGWDIAALELGLDVVGIEWDDAACATRAAAGLRTVQADVAALSPEAFADELGGGVEGFIASAPCPTFSAAGGRDGLVLMAIILRCLGDLAERRDTRAAAREEAFVLLEPLMWAKEQAAAAKKRREPDRAKSAAKARRAADMSMLVCEPVRWVEQLRPTWVALEQVPEVMPIWRATAEILSGWGYSVWAGVLEAERYGVAQTRDRAILIAHADRAVTPPPPTHQKYVPRPATTVAGDSRVHPPGHKRNASDEAAGRDHYEGRAGENAIRVTLEEAAILQSFPPDYPFQGTRTKKFQQVGNAVPPLLAYRVLEQLVGQAEAREAA
jgi:DNA (cytosine-5)-methyltransferase 1